MTTALRTHRRLLFIVLIAIVVAVAIAAALPRLAGAVSAPPEVRIESINAAGRKVATGRSGRIDARASVGRSARTIVLPIRADMLGASWVGAAERIQLRAFGADHRWSDWTTLVAERNEGPDADSREAKTMRGRQSVTNPIWVADATRVQVRSVSAQMRVRDVRIVALNTSGTSTLRDRSINRARGTAATMLRSMGVRAAGSQARAAVASPGIRLRSKWGAARPKTTPQIAPELQALVVHHTVSTNNYSCASTANMIRGIQAYHMRSQGWNDIGYNFLVDRCGRVWEGRGGGITKPVIGAHTYGFNTGTAGIALLGTFEGVRPSAAARAGLTKIIAWRADVAHINPTGRSILIARNTDKFQAGQRVIVRTVSGHRDLYRTACPGRLAYGQINPVRRTAWKYGGPKFVNPTGTATTAANRMVNSLRVQAAANGNVYWRLEVRRISTGELVTLLTKPNAQRVDFRWNATAAGIPDYDLKYRLFARSRGVEARAWGGQLANVPPAPGLSLLVAAPASITPNGDGIDDAFTATVRMDHPASISFDLVTSGTTQIVAPLITWRSFRAPGPDIVLSAEVPDTVADGDYDLRIRAYDSVAGRTAPITMPVHISRL